MTETTILDDSAVSEIEDRAGDKWTVNTDTIRALCATVKHLRANHKQLSLASGEWATLLDRIQAWSKCEDSYPLDEHINNITVQRERLQAEVEQLRAENEALKKHADDLNHDLECAVKECNENHG